MDWGKGARALRAIACAVLLLLGSLALPGAIPGPADARADSTGIRVPILVYHNIDYSGSAYAITPDLLDAQCRWLVENGYTAITLGQFYNAAFGAGTLPPNPVVLTNDDGWQSAVTFAEILGRYGLVGNYFINNHSPLTADQIYYLMGNGPIHAHTVSHQHMPQLDYETQLAEIVQNKTYIEGITGVPVQFVAWPFGEYNELSIQAAADAGMIGAFGLGGVGCVIGAAAPYRIPRIMMEATDTLETFAAKVSAW